MIEILTSGVLNTVQDGGRRGYLASGLSRCGAMDRLAYEAGNALVGNRQDEASIEIAFFPFRVRFGQATRFALTGAECGATLDGHLLPPFWTRVAAAGQVLSLGPPRRGARAYLAVAGGLALPPVMGSRATDAKGRFGGLEGRGLERGDRLATMQAPTGPADAGFGAVLPVEQAGPRRVIEAAEYDIFDDDSRHALTAADWTVSSDANRLGYRLNGPTLRPRRPLELFSHGIVPGILQVPANGQPMIQLADANTCGGYPKIATVIEPDLWRVAQARVGEKLRFVLIDLDAAVSALNDQADWIAEVRSYAARWL